MNLMVYLALPLKDWPPSSSTASLSKAMTYFTINNKIQQYSKQIYAKETTSKVSKHSWFISKQPRGPTKFASVHGIRLRANAARCNTSLCTFWLVVLVYFGECYNFLNFLKFRWRGRMIIIIDIYSISVKYVLIIPVSIYIYSTISIKYREKTF